MTTADQTPVRTLCSYCGVGCGISVTTNSDGLIAKVVGDKLHPTNQGRLCTKGATHAEMMAADGRLRKALVRDEKGRPTRTTDVNAAIKLAGQRLREIRDEHGPDAIALYVSGQMTMEAQYLAAKLAKGFLRTKHLEANSRLCMASAGTGYKQSLGADAPPGSYDDFDHADVFLVTGANMADCHPILFLRMMDRVKQGAKLIVVDPRRTATADKADLFLQIKPGTDIALLNGLLHLIVKNGHLDSDFIADHTDGWEGMEEFLEDYTPADVARLTGLAEDDVRTAAEWIGTAPNWMSAWTMGLNQSTHGTWNTNSLINLHLATGAIGRTGSGPFSLTGQPNAMGGREMGYMGPGLPGQRSVFDDDDRAFVEDVWGLPAGSIRAESGTGTVAMYQGLAAGEIKAAWIICSNPVASMANRWTVVEGLETAEVVITQDAFADTATNAYADIVLPAAMWSELEGVMVNSERNLTLLKPSTEAPGQAMPDWRIIAAIAAELGYAEAFSYESSEQIFDEIRRFNNEKTGYDLRGITYDRLRQQPVQWPSPPGDTETRHPNRYPDNRFATDNGRAKFLPRPHMDAAEMPDDEFPFVLNTGRVQHQWHTMTKTGRVDKLNKLNPSPFVEIHPADAERFGIVEGGDVEIVSRRGRAVLPATITDRVQPGQCFAPFHWNDEHGEYVTINAVTNDAVDPDSLQPEFKVTAVRMRAVESLRKPEEVPVSGAPTPAQTLAAAVGAPTVAPASTDAERTFLGGFFAALDLMPVTGVPVLPSSAPVSVDTRLWVDGLLAGMYSRSAVETVAPAPVEKPVLILWASQTGNAADLAADVSTELAAKGVRARMINMNDCELSDLEGAEQVVIVSSTFGDGGPPDNGADFWDRLAANDAPQLKNLRYAVLAIGDPSYSDFCGHGRNLDERLTALGATALLERVDCEIGDDEHARTWIDNLATALRSAPVTKSPTELKPAPVKPAGVFTRDNPQSARVVRNERISGTGERDVRQVGFELPEGCTYDVGDALGVFAYNSEANVAEWLAAAGLDASTLVDLGDGELSLGEALRTRLDISVPTPKFLKFIAAETGDHRLAKLLRRDNKIQLGQWLWGRHQADVLREFPMRADAVDWLGVLSKLTPRQYSISSSPLVSPNEVQLTVGVVRYENENGTPRGGVCSTFLADRADDVQIFLQRAPHFRPPADPDTPIIMIGPGTGIAPFRGFLHERRELGGNGRNWLFFGGQHAATNFYYRDELEEMFRDGTLTRLDLAFSRDQRERIYVQHRMIEHGAELWRWLQDGAHIYVCGDASRMAKDVDDTLLRIVRTHGKLTEEAALAYKKKLVSEKRYVRDVY
ncbi:bifunctional nitrate reductase/sulfite reductase flavoprotein subunit alpha [Smaragdicoccus niigatensis]|uniref:bifunctional nitrate reductase/sulfite reductase flavoprotein subunit alpha n=1 Tax=Smaragdicoccus niigatensis TaxID=359359 RepID=UPI00058E7427|nr:bifunctional nitrate reductase/sulfite reductase flavoprotein subunit alpha [Smaragdicoccus niigatensis]